MLFIAILCIILIIGISIYRMFSNRKIETMRANGKHQNLTDEEIENIINRESIIPIPSWSTPVLSTISGVSLFMWFLSMMFFYAEPTHIYHIRTVFNQERVISTLGWTYYGGGKVEPWKKGVSIQAAGNTGAEKSDQISADGASISANLLPQNIIFLDQVDADASATARFRIPTDPKKFLTLAHEYRNPKNFLLTALIPAFKETLQATASLMSAEEYFAGARTEFAFAFENQLSEGIYQVKRKEVTIYDDTQDNKGSADSSTVQGKQKPYGGKTKTIFKVVKQLDKEGNPKRKLQTFKKYGVTVIEAHIPDMDPNSDFDIRMKDKQKASADRAIARETRIQEEEQKLLVMAKGEREIAEEQAAELKIQMQQTTAADTTKALALITANLNKEQAEIDKITAQTLLDKANIDAEAITVTANAQAHARKVKILSDNGLLLKINALIRMNADNAKAFAARKVPTTVVYSGGDSKGQLGSSNDMNTVVTSQMLKNLKALNLDVEIKK
jgi:hypothetical protein